MEELQAGSLCHFDLRLLVCGGKGILYCFASCAFELRLCEGPDQDELTKGVGSPGTSDEPMVILVSPVKHRKSPHSGSSHKIKPSTPDKEVWEMEDNEIIGMPVQYSVQ